MRIMPHSHARARRRSARSVRARRGDRAPRASAQTPRTAALDRSSTPRAHRRVPAALARSCKQLRNDFAPEHQVRQRDETVSDHPMTVPDQNRRNDVDRHRRDAEERGFQHRRTRRDPGGVGIGERRGDARARSRRRSSRSRFTARAIVAPRALVRGAKNAAQLRPPRFAACDRLRQAPANACAARRRGCPAASRRRRRRPAPAHATGASDTGSQADARR